MLNSDMEEDGNENEQQDETKRMPRTSVRGGEVGAFHKIIRYVEHETVDREGEA